MSANNSVIEQYLRQVGNALDCPRPQKKVILDQLRSSLADIPDIEDKNLGDIYEIAGKPSDAVAFYMEEEGQRNVSRNLTKRNRIRWIIAVIVMISLVTALILYGIYVFEAVDYAHGYSEESPAVAAITTPDPNALGTY